MRTTLFLLALPSALALRGRQLTQSSTTGFTLTLGGAVAGSQTANEGTADGSSSFVTEGAQNATVDEGGGPFLTSSGSTQGGFSFGSLSSSLSEGGTAVAEGNNTFSLSTDYDSSATFDEEEGYTVSVEQNTDSFGLSFGGASLLGGPASGSTVGFGNGFTLVETSAQTPNGTATAAADSEIDLQANGTASTETPLGSATGFGLAGGLLSSFSLGQGLFHP